MNNSAPLALPRISLRGLVLLGFAAVLAACGGGGGSPAPASVSTTLSGTAAAGAPIVGTVTVKDSSTPPKEKTVTIAADGNYTVDVAGLTAPFMMRADGTAGGRSYSLYSAAAAADVGGTINVTPLTDLIVANIAGQIASNFYASGNFSSLTTEALTVAATQLQARLQPILAAVGVGGSIDLLRTSFAANHSGLDAALDVLRVTVDPATAKATILNIIDNQQIIDDLASKTDATVILATNVGAGLSDFQKIAAGFEAFSNLFATSMPASNNASLAALFHPDFLLDGLNRTRFLSEIASQNLVGLKFTGLVLVPNSLTPAAAPTQATVKFDVVFNGATQESLSFQLRKVGDNWLMYGNQRIAQTDAMAFARLQDVLASNGAPAPNTIDTGLTFEISDPAGLGISYALVKGRGLPVGGALYVNRTGNSSFGASTGTYNMEATMHLNQAGHNQYPLSDAVIQTLTDDEVYTIELWKDNGTTAMGDDTMLASYAQALTKRPYKVSELTVSSFAGITAPTQGALTAFANAGGSITVNWTLPASMKSSSLHYFRSGATGSDTQNVDLAATTTSGVLTMSPFPPSSGTLQANGINLTIVDSFRRELTTIYNGTPP